MEQALAEAEKAFAMDEIPVGAVIVYGEEVVGRGFNQRERLQNPIAHAEMLAIAQAAEKLCSWRLLDTILYVTMEPCAMCAGAMVLARIKTVVYAIADPKGGACGTVFDIAREPQLNHCVEVIAGVGEEQSRSLIQKFFREKRRQKKKQRKKSTDE